MQNPTCNIMDFCPATFYIFNLQQTNIARALVKRADVYIFDESFSNIDDNTKLVLFYNIIEYLKNKIIVFITHDENIIKRSIGNVWLLKNQALQNIHIPECTNEF